MFLKKISLFFVFFLVSCGSIDFVYDNNTNLNNPIYNKTIIELSGVENSYVYKYSSRYFGEGSSSDQYRLNINIEEEKTKRSIQTNQAVSKMDYKLIFNYILIKNNKNCEVLNMSIASRFTHEPKAEGYNFGSDQSLERLYELATKNNLQDFIDKLSNKNTFKCINEN